MLDMMSTTYEGQKLQPSFTFRIVEMVKQIKIQSAPRTPRQPWRLLATTGIVLIILSFSPHLISLSLRGDGNDGILQLPNTQHAFAPPLAPKGQGETWTKKADMPTARARLSTSVVDGKIYAIGGLLGGWALAATVEEYDAATDKWTKKADMSIQRFGLSASVVNGKIYAIGGHDGQRYLSTVEEYDPKMDKWTRKANMLTPRGFLSTSVVNGNIYAIGGQNNASGALSTVEEYDPATDTWKKKADMLTGRFDPSTSVVNGKIYAIGGGDVVAVGLSAVEEYDPATDTWAKKADMPTGRFILSTSVVNGNIYAVGGVTKLKGVKSYFSTVEECDPETDTWLKKADMSTPRAYLSTSVVKGKIYAIGGSRQWPVNILRQWPVPLATVEEYTPEGWPFSVSPQGKKKLTWGKMKTEK